MHHSPDKYLTCGDGMNLDCCEVTTITSDYSMAIITMYILYSVLSCRSTPPEAMSVMYG
jgi:hypothetical protein